MSDIQNSIVEIEESNKFSSISRRLSPYYTKRPHGELARLFFNKSKTIRISVYPDGYVIACNKNTKKTIELSRVDPQKIKIMPRESYIELGERLK